MTSEKTNIWHEKAICLGCQKPSTALCHSSGKCLECCDNECGCGFRELADESRYDNLCESKWLKSQPKAQ